MKITVRCNDQVASASWRIQRPVETSASLIVAWTIPSNYLNDLMSGHDLNQLRAGSALACLLSASIAAADQSYT